MGNLLATKVVCSNVALTQHITNVTELEDLLTEKIKNCKYPIPGLSLSYISKDQGNYYYNFGVQDVKTNKPMTSKSMYHLFDGTNIFTATAIMQLFEQNQLKLTDAVSSYLNQDYFINYTKTIKTRQLLSNSDDISIANLLTHSAPLPDAKKGYYALHLPQTANLFDDDLDDENTSFNTLNALKNFGKFSIDKVPKNLYSKYNHFGYAMLGEIIQNANEEKLEYAEYIKQKILDPLNMSHTAFGYNKYDKNAEYDSQHIVSGYIHKYGLMVPTLRYFCGKNIYKQLIKHSEGKLYGLNEFEMDSLSNNGIICSVEDLSVFLHSHFLKNDDVILKDEYLRMMQDNMLYGGIGIESKYAQGYGWKIGIMNENNDDVVIRFLNSEGYGAGFTTEMRIYPDDDCAIIVCCNYSPSTKKGIFKFMHQLIHTVFKCMDVIELELETKTDDTLKTEIDET